MQDQRPSKTSHFQPPTQPEKVQSPGMQVASEPQVSPTAQSSGVLQASRSGAARSTHCPSPRRQANPGAQSLSYQHVESDEKTGQPGRSSPATSRIADPPSARRDWVVMERTRNQAHCVRENCRNAPPIRCCPRLWWNIMVTREEGSKALTTTSVRSSIATPRPRGAFRSSPARRRRVPDPRFQLTWLSFAPWTDS